MKNIFTTIFKTIELVLVGLSELFIVLLIGFIVIVGGGSLLKWILGV